ncbi:MAG: putative DNA binding domain-containing protein [Saprospiraceae bacterium]|nr:putative DNA binding domain-containing protein [Saprospiraceae bacterium]
MSIAKARIIRALSGSPAFQYLDEKEILALSAICRYEVFLQGQIIFSENQPVNSFYLIEKGKVNLIFNSRQIIHVSKGQIFGDWAVLNETVRLATAKSMGQLNVIAIDAYKFKDSRFLDSRVSFKIVLELAKGLVSRLQSKSQVSSRILISGGETDQVEFKSTLRKNLFTGEKDPAMEMAVVKTIAGFLNTDGGVLFVGVNDEGEILGIQHDDFANADKLLLHLNQVITARMGDLILGDVHISIVTIDEHKIVRVDCTPSHAPVLVTDKGLEYFYVRSGVQTIAYSMKMTFQYLKQRF